MCNCNCNARLAVCDCFCKVLSNNMKHSGVPSEQVNKHDNRDTFNIRSTLRAFKIKSKPNGAGDNEESWKDRGGRMGL